MATTLKDRIAAYDKQSASQSPSPASSAVVTVDDVDQRSASPFQNSPDSYASSASSEDRASTLDGVAIVEPIVATAPCRTNEHLAVLIPRHLWKLDRLASRCDKYACRVKFSLFERKHHCRKCGGIYCHACSARTTLLLDTTHLPFLLPPKNTPVAQFAAPNAPVIDARVCDDCYEQLHGYPTPRDPPSPSRGVPLTYSSSSLSTTLSPATPPDGGSLTRAYSASNLAFPTANKPRTPYWPMPPPVKTTKLEGDLDRYPLKDPSATCKAAGGGRWQPKRYPLRWDARLPDGRIRYEVEVERMEEEARLRRANPVIVDGEIRVRKLRRPPSPPRGGPYKLPTF